LTTTRGIRPPGRPRSAEADEAILASTLRLLARHGYDRTSIDAVAADAGVARATVYRRYPTKADLVGTALGCMRGQPSDEPPGDLRRFLVDALTGMRDSMHEHDGLGILGALLANRREYPEMLDTFRERVITPCGAKTLAALRAGQERGEVRADADLELAGDMMVGAFFAQELAGRSTEGENWPERVVAAIWPAIAAGPAPGSRPR
jgi:AcrR family transcriptional regulator